MQAVDLGNTRQTHHQSFQEEITWWLGQVSLLDFERDELQGLFELLTEHDVLGEETLVDQQIQVRLIVVELTQAS